VTESLFGYDHRVPGGPQCFLTRCHNRPLPTSRTSLGFPRCWLDLTALFSPRSLDSRVKWCIFNNIVRYTFISRTYSLASSAFDPDQQVHQPPDLAEAPLFDPRSFWFNRCVRPHRDSILRSHMLSILACVMSRRQYRILPTGRPTIDRLRARINVCGVGAGLRTRPHNGHRQTARIDLSPKVRDRPAPGEMATPLPHAATRALLSSWK
jgi:hypothetical protein